MLPTEPGAALPASDDFVGGTGLVADMHGAYVRLADLDHFQRPVDPVDQGVLEYLVFFIQRLKPGQSCSTVEALKFQKVLNDLIGMHGKELGLQMPDPSRIGWHARKRRPATACGLYIQRWITSTAFGQLQGGLGFQGSRLQAKNLSQGLSSHRRTFGQRLL